jgi:hypothetical protein
MIILVLLLTIFIFPQQICAEWGRAADEYFRLPLYQDAKLCSDGNGGCWATAYPAGLCHVDRDGNLTWGDEPYGLPGDCFYTKIVLAANGDVILAGDIVYEANDPQNVFLQRINLDQELLWGEGGIAIDTSSRNQWLIGTYAGPLEDTYLIHWIRRDENSDNYDPRLQLINGDGNCLWGVGGIGLNWPHYNSHFAVTTDQCVIAAQNVSPTPSVEIRKINSEREQMWNSRFSTLWEDVRQRTISDAESDREGGVILVYEYDRLENNDDTLRYYGIKVMRVSGDGDSLWIMQVYERETESRYENFGQINPIINYAGSGAFFVAWADWPHAFQVVSLDIGGEYLWDEPVDIQLNPVGYGALDAVDSNGGVCYVWRDVDPDRENIQQLSGQRISVDGERMWGDRGRAIQARNVERSSITTDGNGGIITVVEPRPTVQMINRNGEIGVVLEVGVDDEIDRPNPFGLSPQLFIYPAFPNPFNSTTEISFNLSADAQIRLTIHDIQGRELAVLQDGNEIAGTHAVSWDATGLASGVYFCRLQSEGKTATVKLAMIR